MVTIIFATLPALPAMPNIIGIVLTTLYGILDICIGVMAAFLPVLSLSATVQAGIFEFLPFLNGVAYFIPISQMIVFGGSWVTAIMSYYCVRSIMKLLHIL